MIFHIIQIYNIEMHTGSEPMQRLGAAVCSLADVLSVQGPLTENETRAVAVAAAAELARIHDAGLIHGQIEPANLLLTADGELELTNPGAPAGAAPTASGIPGPTRAHTQAATTNDVVALAVTLVELATGTVLDPAVAWPADILWRLGCPLALGTDLARVLDADTAPAAHDLGPMFGSSSDRGSHRSLTLPEPVVPSIRTDPTPTMDYMPILIGALKALVPAHRSQANRSS